MDNADQVRYIACHWLNAWGNNETVQKEIVGGEGVTESRWTEKLSCEQGQLDEAEE